MSNLEHERLQQLVSRVNRFKKMKQNALLASLKTYMSYETHSIVSIDEVCHEIRQNFELPFHQKDRAKHSFNDVLVGISSLRLLTFAYKGIVCASCGVVGKFFHIERNAKQSSTTGHHNYHLNLWADTYEGFPILMTHDHIVARGLGGRDSLENTQPMCTYCNSVKSIEESQLAEIARKMVCRNEGSTHLIVPDKKKRKSGKLYPNLNPT